MLIFTVYQSSLVIYIYIYSFLRLVVSKMRVGKGRIGSLGFADAN